MSKSHKVPTLGVAERVSGLRPGYRPHPLYCRAMVPSHQGSPHVVRVCLSSQVRQTRQAEKAQCEPIPIARDNSAKHTIITLGQVMEQRNYWLLEQPIGFTAMET